MDGVQQKDKARIEKEREYRRQERDCQRILQQRNAYREEVQVLRQRCQNLEYEIGPLRRDNYRAEMKIEHLEDQLGQLRKELSRLKKQLAAVKAEQPKLDRPLPAFVKANVAGRPRKRPGREPGHPGAFRAMPKKIDREIDVPLPRNAAGVCCCPKCGCQLLKVENLRRIIEDIVPSEAIVECYNTQRGYCPKCDKVVESRAAEQPPAADIPGPQVGINALAMAAILRSVYRLPYEPITQLLADISGLSVCPGTISRQMQRMGNRLEKMTGLLGVRLKLSDSVHMDETSWRVNGQNRWLWVLMNAHYTLFHVDKSRGSEVVRKLLGAVYGGTLHTDFYSAYGEIDCKKQKCLVHLLRELRDTAEKSQEFAQGAMCRRLKRLIREMLVLKKRRGKLAGKLYQQRGRRLEQRLMELAKGSYGDEHSRRIANRLRRHEQELTCFLWEDGVEADNNAAERALRPAVIMRKITGGSRSERGAKATAILLSITRTIRQQDLPLLETYKDMLMASWANQPFDFPDKPQPDSS